MFEAQVNNSVIKVISKSLEIGTSEPIIVYYNEMLDIYIDESTRLLKRSFKTIYEFSLTMMYILIVCGTFGIAAIFIFIKGWGCKEPPQREYSDMDIK